MQKLLLAVAAIGLTLSGFGQGAVIIDNNNAGGYLDIYRAGNHYTGPFGFELWYKNSAAASDTAINSLNGINPPEQYALLTADGFTLATHINPGAPGTTAVGGIVSGIGQVNIPGINRTVANGSALFGIVFWLGSSSFGAAWNGGVLTFNNPTADYTLPLPPPAPTLDNWPVDLVMPAPEPGVFALAGLGAVILLVFRRRSSCS